MEKYDHKKIEAKWQAQWEKEQAFQAQDDSQKPKFYGLIEFPYPSGNGLHVGHIRSNTAIDIISRKRRMDGYEVLYPIGWDAFGLPTENYAIKTGRAPAEITKENTDIFRRQLKSLGFSFDWSREINTTEPEYYKWTQWIFLRMLKAGLAYKKKMPINWCLSCKIGLANEEVVAGKCERCGGETETREKEQWMLAITKYADRLDADLDKVNFLEKIKIQQRNWIGRSEGITISYPVEGMSTSISVFTTRPDTNFGATFVAVAPDSAFIRENIEGLPNREEVSTYVENAVKKSEIERTNESRKKTGIATGLFAMNHLTRRKMPIYVSDFVLGHVGTGALVGVPGHDLRDFEFAQEMGLEVIRVVVGKDGDTSPIARKEQVQEEEGIMVNSDFLDGADIHLATKKIMDHLEANGWGKRTVTYKLRDWVFSRQRYWGEPIPVVHCLLCGIVPLPEDDLPLVLPPVEKYQPTETGESPLASIDEWVNTVCPACGAPAKRETDTMPNWAGSSWYFLAYIMQGVSDFKFPIENYTEVFRQWLPINWYNGGMEHTTLHLLYSRFWHKFLFDEGFVPTEEPYSKRTSHGLVLADGGAKMSKSKGNVINPDELVERYGADAVRLYEMFMAPFDQAVAWDSKSIAGVYRFLEKVWRQQNKLTEAKSKETLERLVHQTIKKVGEDVEEMRFNTAVSSMMILVNEMDKSEAVSRKDYESLVLLLSGFAPHVAEELWSTLGNSDYTHETPWPAYDSEKLSSTEHTITVQVGGKVRDIITTTEELDETAARARALALPKVEKWIDGKKIVKMVYLPNKLINIVTD